jgi:uncharacterized protein with HEPN domain
MPDKFGDKIRLRHILDAIESINAYVANTDYIAFSGHPMMQDACIRQLQVIGEACSKVSPALRDKHPQIPWQQIIGLRIIVIHEYFGVDDIVIWDVIEKDLPELMQQVDAIWKLLE